MASSLIALLPVIVPKPGDDMALAHYCKLREMLPKDGKLWSEGMKESMIFIAETMSEMERFRGLFDMHAIADCLDPVRRAKLNLKIDKPEPTSPAALDLNMDMDLDTNEAVIAANGRVSRSPTPDAEDNLASLVNDVPDIVPPFIFLRCMENYAATLSQLSALLPCGFVSKVAGEFIRIAPCSGGDSDSIVKFLKDGNHEFFLGSCAPYKVVIKGLPLVTACDDLILELTKLGFEPTKVTRPTGRNGKHPLSILVVESPRRPGNNRMLNISSLFGVDVKVEPFRKRGSIMQCYQCNWFGHAASHCHMKARCLKCGENHASRDCILPRRDDPFCINCLQKGHVACSRSCTMFPKRPPAKRSEGRTTFVKRPSRNVKKKTRPNQFNSPAVTSISKTSLPCPNHFNSPSTFTKPQQLNDVALILELFKQLTSIFSGEKGLKSLIQQLQGKASAIEKLQVFLDFFAAADAPPTGQPGASKD